ncbi:MAG: PQQ-binding-like beta-propeller repeat protein [Ktedonobacterales bacterium]
MAVSRATPIHSRILPYKPSRNGTYATAYAADQTLTDWPQGGFDGSGARNNTSETILTTGNVGGLTVAPGWPVPVANPQTVQPIVLGGNLYTLGGSEVATPQLFGMNAMTGAQFLPTSSSPYMGRNPSGLGGGLAGNSGTVYTVGYDSRAYAFNGTSGAEIGDPLYPGAYYSGGFSTGMAIAGSFAYAGLGGQLLAINLSTGKVIWTLQTGDEIETTPAVTGGVVYATSSDGRLYAVNATTGTSLPTWGSTVPGSMGNVVVPGGTSPQAQVAVANGLIYIVCFDNRIRAFSTTNGSLVWTSLPGNYNNIGETVAVGDNLVFVAGQDSYGNSGVVAFDASNLEEEWVAVDQYGGGPPTLANGVLYFADYNGDLYAFNANGCGGPTVPTVPAVPTVCPTSTALWQTTVQGNPGPPIVVNGMVYVQSSMYDQTTQSEIGSVYAFSLP